MFVRVVSYSIRIVIVLVLLGLFGMELFDIINNDAEFTLKKAFHLLFDILLSASICYDIYKSKFVLKNPLSFFKSDGGVTTTSKVTMFVLFCFFVNLIVIGVIYGVTGTLSDMHVADFIGISAMIIVFGFIMFYVESCFVKKEEEQQ